MKLQEHTTPFDSKNASGVNDRKTNQNTNAEAKKRNKKVNIKREKEYNKRKHVRYVDIKKGDQVLTKQEKSSTKPPYDPRPYTITDTKGTQDHSQEKWKNTKQK